VLIRAPANRGSLFHSYRGSNAIILMANLITVFSCTLELRLKEMVSHFDAFSKCSVFPDLRSNSLPNGSVIAGDDEFPLETCLMKPYSRTQLSSDENLPSHRLSRGRRTFGNGFGNLGSRSRVFEETIACDVDSWQTNSNSVCFA
jgi:hypothetical protein